MGSNFLLFYFDTWYLFFQGKAALRSFHGAEKAAVAASPINDGS
jgi:hypothetical protein